MSLAHLRKLPTQLPYPTGQHCRITVLLWIEHCHHAQLPAPRWPGSQQSFYSIRQRHSRWQAQPTALWRLTQPFLTKQAVLNVTAYQHHWLTVIFWWQQCRQIIMPFPQPGSFGINSHGQCDKHDDDHAHPLTCK